MAPRIGLTDDEKAAAGLTSRAGQGYNSGSGNADTPIMCDLISFKEVLAPTVVLGIAFHGTNHNVDMTLVAEQAWIRQM